MLTLSAIEVPCAGTSCGCHLEIWMLWMQDRTPTAAKEENTGVAGRPPPLQCHEPLNSNQQKPACNMHHLLSPLLFCKMQWGHRLSCFVKGTSQSVDWSLEQKLWNRHQKFVTIGTATGVVPCVSRTILCKLWHEFCTHLAASLIRFAHFECVLHTIVAWHTQCLWITSESAFRTEPWLGLHWPERWPVQFPGIHGKHN